VQSDWAARHVRSLADEPIVRLVLDGTAVRVRFDCEATSILLLVVIGVRTDGQKVQLAATPEEIAARRKAFLREWRFKRSSIAPDNSRRPATAPSPSLACRRASGEAPAT